MFVQTANNILQNSNSNRVIEIVSYLAPSISNISNDFKRIFEDELKLSKINKAKDRKTHKYKGRKTERQKGRKKERQKGGEHGRTWGVWVDHHNF